MKVVILLASIVLTAQAVDVWIGFDGIRGTRYGTAWVEASYDDDWNPVTFDFRTFMDIEAPFPTTWTYSVNGTQILSGTEDFCDPVDQMGPGGIAIKLLRDGLGFNDSSCPFPRYTTFRNQSWNWAEAQALDLDEIFTTAALIMDQASMSANVSMDMQQSAPMNSSDPDTSNPGDAAADPSPVAGPGGMKKRRRDTSLLSIILETENECVSASFILGVKV